jgi:hypothetical protein
MKNQPCLENISLARISANEKFRLSFNRPLEPLLNSMREIGQTTPVLCRKTSKGLELFSGFLRYEAMRKLRIKSGLALVWDAKDLSAKVAFKIAFFENALTRGLNIVEQAMAARALKNFGLSLKQIAKEYFQKAGLPAGIPAIESLLRVDSLEYGWKQFLADKDISLRYASELARLSSKDRKALSFIPSLRATASQFREILEMTAEISKARDKTFAEVWEAEELKAVLNEKTNAGQKLDLLTRMLEKIRHPNYAKLLARHQQLCAKLGVPAGARLDPSDYFEGPEYRIQFTVNSSANVRELFSKLLSASANPEWEKLFELDDED